VIEQHHRRSPPLFELKRDDRGAYREQWLVGLQEEQHEHGQNNASSGLINLRSVL
jgi:hypothetical protein